MLELVVKIVGPIFVLLGNVWVSVMFVLVWFGWFGLVWFGWFGLVGVGYRWCIMSLMIVYEGRVYMLHGR